PYDSTTSCSSTARSARCSEATDYTGVRLGFMSIETTGRGALPPIRLGIAGLGLAGSFMIRAAVAHPRIALCAAMDPLPRPREAFGQQFNAPVYSSGRSDARRQACFGREAAGSHARGMR